MRVCNIEHYPPLVLLHRGGMSGLVTHIHTHVSTHMQMPLKLESQRPLSLKGRTVAFVCMCVCVRELQHVYCLCFTRGESHYMSKCDSHLRQNDRGFVAGADGNLDEKKTSKKEICSIQDHMLIKTNLNMIAGKCQCYLGVLLMYTASLVDCWSLWFV